MSIAIMACRKLVGQCAGTGCFDAYNNLTDTFRKYENSKPILSSFFYCSGCDTTISDQEDWNHKIEQLKRKKVDTIHIALCIDVECDNYNKHEKLLKNHGFNVIHGTHK
ncbi:MULTISPECIES: CGGC domain-containing protein [unclassified Clostridium]|uniref:CGGC domain-containing protein n=1 Tax=unclassified Clostridium TaxID=2614128 RepID=UPI000E8BAD10|nr:CGGC domain-containing protein [Clostridium sp.]